MTLVTMLLDLTYFFELMRDDDPNISIVLWRMLMMLDS